MVGSCGKRESQDKRDNGRNAGQTLDSIPGGKLRGWPPHHFTSRAWASDVGFGSCIQVAQLPLSLKDSNWHHICIAWTTRDGLWSAYQDGELRGSGENLAAWHPIKPHGILILGQEQVRLGESPSKSLPRPLQGL